MSFRAHLSSLPIFLLLLSLVLPAAPAGAEVFERQLPLGEAWDPARPCGHELAELLAAPDEDRGFPPRLSWCWLLPDGEKILAVELVATREEQVAALKRVPRRRPLVSNEGNEARATGEPLLGDADYALAVSAPLFLHGRAFQSITLTPLRAEQGRLYGLKAATLRIVTAADPAARATLRPLRPDFPLRERVTARLGGALLNPEALPLTFDRALGGDGFPTEVPSIEGAAVDMVIVTVDSLADLCQGYAEQRTARGVATVTRTVEWMQERYPFGSDRAELIRNFARDAYAKWSLRYLLLVGDVREIPVRYAYNEVFGPRSNPTDLYYACLDGNWNADGDAFWAEPADTSQGDWGDEADFLPELALGRLPVSSRSECANLLAKTQAYQDCASTPYQSRFLMLAEVLFPADWDGDPDHIYVDGAECCDSVYNDSTGPAQHVVRLYENHISYPGSEPLTLSAAFDSLCNGWGVVLHNGHGARQTMSVGNGALETNLVSQLSNGDDTFLMYMINCTAAAFDFDCLAETFLSNMQGGAFGVIGATRETFPEISDDYVYVFFDRLYNIPGLRLGDLYAAMMASQEPLTIEDTPHRWAHTTITMLADPSTWLHYELVEQLQVDNPPSLPLDAGPLTLTVSGATSGPLPDALVTLRKSNEDYQRGVTDANGQVTFTLNPETVGVYQLRVDARDAVPYEDSFTVTSPGSGPLLSLAAVAVDDVPDGVVQGNGNGIAERGETLRLILTLANSGLYSAGNTSAVLRSLHPALALIDSTDSYGDLPPGGSDPGTDHYLVQVADAADDAILACELEIVCDEGVYGEDFFLEAASPLLAIYRSEIDDTAGGDGDGELELGETADLYVALANYGRGAAQGVTASIEAPDGSGLLVQAGTDALGDLAPLSSNLGPAQFNIRRVSADPPLLDLLLADILGRVDTLGLLLEYPGEVTAALEFAYGLDFSRLTVNWEPPPEGDAAAYIVLRAGSPGGPFLEISEHWVECSTYEDSGLDAYTSYWYRVQPLSAAGLGGALSESYEARTNPALLPGWPVTLGAESSSTPLVADVDGDGDLEIIVAADVLYGFNPDGTELSDGDDDPDTIGPLALFGNGYASALAGAELTASPGLEVIAASWNTYEVYVFEFELTANGTEASVAPGWPQGVPHVTGIWASPSLGDVDGDGDLEIFITETGGAGCLMAWQHDGTEVIDGDNNPGTHGVFHSQMGGWPRSTAAFADLDDDGDMEIFVGTGAAHGYLKGLDGDGSNLAGFPFLADSPSSDSGEKAIFCSPAIGDVDGDGRPEIAFAAENDSLYLLDHDGSRHEGWPIYWDNDNWSLCPSPALADVTGDGLPEIFACAISDYHHMEVACFDSAGHYLPGWPQAASFSTQSSPVVGDLDGDGDLELILGNDFAALEAWHHDGTHVNGFPIITGNFVRSTPALLDINQDGCLDMILVSWDRNVYIWTFPVTFEPERFPWYAFMHDQMRTGNLDTDDWIVGVEEESAVAPGAVRLDPNWPNPFNPSTRIRFTIGGSETSHVRLSIHDVRGRRLLSLVDAELSPGIHLRDWDGRDAAGRTLASGVYLARLEVSGSVESRKLVLLR